MCSAHPVPIYPVLSQLFQLRVLLFLGKKWEGEQKRKPEKDREIKINRLAPCFSRVAW